MLSNSDHKVDKLAIQVRIMKNELERRVRDMTQKLQDADTRIRALEGRADEGRSHATTALSETTSTEVIEM